MNTLQARVVLLDIEGTVGSIAFVHDVLFPFAEERMDKYVRLHRDEPEVREILRDAAAEAAIPENDIDGILEALHGWSERDVKVTPLKALQGLIWGEGFESSGLRGHLYEDAIAAIRRFHSDGITLAIYSSGSVAAQKLLFGHTIVGDLLPLLSGFYDTTIGNKRERGSYDRIVAALGVTPHAVLFFSDNTAELDAAQEAGLQTVQVARPEDRTRPGNHHAVIESFDQVSVMA